MLIGSLCDSGSTHSVGFQEYIYQLNFIVVKFHFLFRNKLILILILILYNPPGLPVLFLHPARQSGLPHGMSSLRYCSLRTLTLCPCWPFTRKTLLIFSMFTTFQLSY